MKREILGWLFAWSVVVASCGGGDEGATSSSPDAGHGGAASSTSPASSSSAAGGATPDAGGPLAPKVMIVNMASIEGGGFVSAFELTKKHAVPGLPKSSPDVLCNADDVCQITLGMGYANAATSMTSLLYRSGFDLSETYFVIAGIAGVDPSQGTLGTAAWARTVVDVGFAYEIDAREMPTGWPYGYFGIGAKTPGDPPSNGYDAARFELDEDLLQQALALSKGVKLDDDSNAASFRANYPSAPANAPPSIVQCDIVSSDTWFAGTALNQRAADFAKLATGGDAVACMSAQEDNATLEVLSRGFSAGVVQWSHVAALRTASDFAAPYPGQSDADGLTKSIAQGGLTISVSNLVKASKPLIDAIVKNWSVWRSGVPMP